MAHMVVIYNTPKDTVAFDKHYAEVHIPLVKQIPGLLKYEISEGPLLTPAGPAEYYQVATLYFENMATLKAGIMESEAGKAAATDAQTNIGNPALMLFFDNMEV